MNVFRNTVFTLSSLVTLLSCTPSFETTQEQCESFLPLTSLVTSYQVTANAADNDYKLYLEDMLNSLKDAQTTSVSGTPLDTPRTPTTDEQALLDFIISRATDYMGYVVTDGVVESADNPLDYMESVIAATNPDNVIGTFVEAKQQMTLAIEKDDAFCNYQNTAIRFNQEVEGFNILSYFDASFFLSYIPSLVVEAANHIIDQSVFLTLTEADPDNAEATIETSFAGTDRIHVDNFESSGYSQANIRQISISVENQSENLFADDDFDTTQIGTYAINDLNALCRDENGNTIECPDGIVSRTPQHDSCDGDLSSDEIEQINESNILELNAYDIANSSFTGIQRFRAEIDYQNNEIRVYLSKYADAILRNGASLVDPDGNPIESSVIDAAIARQTLSLEGIDNITSDNNPTLPIVIINPTSCERLAVSQERYDSLTTEEQENFPNGLSAIEVLDLGYDTTYELEDDGSPTVDDEGIQIVVTEPIPIYTFQGTAIVRPTL